MEMQNGGGDGMRKIITIPVDDLPRLSMTYDGVNRMVTILMAPVGGGPGAQPRKAAAQKPDGTGMAGLFESMGRAAGGRRPPAGAQDPAQAPDPSAGRLPRAVRTSPAVVPALAAGRPPEPVGWRDGMPGWAPADMAGQGVTGSVMTLGGSRFGPPLVREVMRRHGSGGSLARTAVQERAGVCGELAYAAGVMGDRTGSDPDLPEGMRTFCMDRWDELSAEGHAVLNQDVLADVSGDPKATIADVPKDRMPVLREALGAAMALVRIYPMQDGWGDECRSAWKRVWEDFGKESHA